MAGPFIFAIIYLILFFITWFIERSLTKVQLKPLDRVFGGVLGFLKTALICGAVVLGMIIYPVPSVQQSLKNSFLAPSLLIYTRKIVFLMPRDYKRKLKHFVEIEIS